LLKLVILPRTRKGLSRAGLRRHLETVHGPLVLAHPEVGGRFLAYMHHYVQDEQDPLFGAPALADRDAVTIICFADPADAGASKSSSAYRDFVGPDEDNFREVEGSIALMAEEQIVRDTGQTPYRKLFLFRSVSAPAKAAAEGWAMRVKAALGPGAEGITRYVVNTAQPIEGDFAMLQFDEIGFGRDADLAALPDNLRRAAADHFPGAASFALMTEPVVFVPFPDTHGAPA
jgi:hypothetical protein